MLKTNRIARLLCTLLLMGASVFVGASDQAFETRYARSIDFLDASDSLLTQGSLQGDELADLLLERGRHFREIGRPVKAVQSLQESIEAAKTPERRGRAEELLGDIYLEQGSHTKAMDFFAMALRHYDEAGLQGAIASARFKTAVVHHRLGQEEMAESLLLRVLADSTIDPFQKALVHETLGEVYYRLVDYEQARLQWNLANSTYPQIGMDSERLENLFRQMQTYAEEKRLEDLRTLSEDAARLVRSMPDSIKASQRLSELAHFFIQTGDTRYAIRYQEEAVALLPHPAGQAASSPAQAGQMADTYLQLGILYVLANRDAEALLAFDDANFRARESESIERQARVARERAHFFSKRERYEEAFASLQEADSLSSLMRQAEVLSLQRKLHEGRFEASPYLRTESDLRTQNEEHEMNQMRNVLIIAVVFFVVLLVLLFREFGQKRKLSKVLEWKVYKRTRELRKANKELNTYIYKSSHDLRTPLTSIKSLLRLLEKEAHNASTKKYLGLINSCTEQMDDILVNLSRAVDYKKVDLKVEQIDFNKLKYQIQEKELANVKGMKIDWDIQEAGVFYSDFKLLKVILIQTISNAVAYRKGGDDDYCKVHIYTDPSGAQIRVEDNGQGISNKVKDKVFDMFVKGTHKSTGAGLGLYLVRIASDKVRAKVRLESEEHKGCTLQFDLPNLN